jgi:hypothetical protein
VGTEGVPEIGSDSGSGPVIFQSLPAINQNLGCFGLAYRRGRHG